MMLVSLWLGRSVALKVKLNITCYTEVGGPAVNSGCNENKTAVGTRGFWKFSLPVTKTTAKPRLLHKCLWCHTLGDGIRNRS